VTIAGSAIVAIGGGGIQTMRRYWERASTNVEGTAREVKLNADRARDDSETLMMPESATAEPASMGALGAKNIPPPPLDL